MPRGHEAPIAAAQNTPEDTFHFDQWEAEVGSTAETLDESRELSPMATRIENAANRIGDFLNKRAVAKDETAAYKENDAYTVDKQAAVTQAENETFATYDSNLAATADREQLESEWNAAADEHRGNLETEANTDNKEFNRAENITKAKQALAKFGRSTSRFARQSAGQIKSGAESVALTAMMGADKIKSGAETASLYALEAADTLQSSANQFSGALKNKLTEAAGSATARVYNRAMTYAANREQSRKEKENSRTAEQERVDRFNENKARFDRSEEAAQVEQMGSAESVYDEAYKENIDMQHAEAIEYNGDIAAERAAEQEAQQEAILASIQAAHNKRARQAKRQERKDFVQDTTSEVWKKSKGLTKRFGRSIARFAKRTGAVAKAGVSAARASWQETAA